MMIKLTVKPYLWIACVGMSLLSLTGVYAAPGVLADAPLFTASSTGGSAPSNIFIVLDDSGSMAGNMLARKHWDTCLYDPAQQTGCTTTTTIGSFSGSALDWRARAYDLNVLSYNPNTTYVPWKKGDGTSFPNAVFTAAKTDPLSTGTTNLNNQFFEIAHDTHGYLGSAPSIINGGSISSRKFGTVITTTIKSAINRTVGANGIVDFWDEHTNYTISTSGVTSKYISYNYTNTPATGTYTCSGTTAIVSPAVVAPAVPSLTVTGCGTNNITVTVNNTQALQAVTGTANVFTTGTNEWGRTLAQELTNYANWYQYYRTRTNVAKGSIAQVVDARPTYRYGLSFIDSTTFVEVPPAGTTNFIPSNVTLLSKMFAVPPSGYTPLPKALDTAGKYFQDGATAGLDMLNRPSPILYECQQNFTILMTDGYWNQLLTTSTYDDVDGDLSHKTVADVARYYYNIDLSPTIWDNKVPTSPFDLNNKQHMVTFTVSFGLVGNLVDLDDDGWPDPDPVNPGFALTENNPNWATSPAVVATNDPPEKIDDLWHAAFNAKGKYISAASPQEMTDAFTDILNTIASRDYKGSVSAVSFNSTTLVSNSSLYLTQFNKPASGSWTGDLIAYGFDPVTGSVNSTEAWKAATVLDARVNPVTTRVILTYNGTKGVPFQWANLTSAQQTDLTIDGNGAVSSTAKAQARLAYLRGDKTNEAGQAGNLYGFRTRTSLLGDIVHHDALFVGKPAQFWPSTPPFPSPPKVTYADFRLSKANRTGVVYVGANDGMLHGFRASDGVELMAYIPNTLYSSANPKIGLHYLTDPSYTHRYYVDMPSVVSDAYFDSGTGISWHTVLVGGEMAGARGVFALDVTTPLVFTEANAAKVALWEFDSTDDADMGYSFAVPSIVMTNAKDASGNGRWAAIFGNGYNSSGNGQASLFILFLDGGLDGTWTPGTDYIKIAAPTGSDTIVSADCTNTGSNCNGLSSPQVFSTKQNSVIDRVYAGDLKGNLWAFDLSSATPAEWSVAYKSGSTPKPLFTATYHKATTAGGIPVQQTPIKVQPITSKPVVVLNKKVAGNPPNLLVSFGTGQYLVSGDPNTTDIQAVYGVWDHGFPTVTPANLVEQTFLSGPFYSNSLVDVTADMRVLSQNPVPYIEKTTLKPLVSDNKQGWMINLTQDPKERLIVDPDVVDQKNLFFNTWVPSAATASVSNNLCVSGGSADGYGYLMTVDLFTGSGTPSPVIDTNANGSIGTDDLIKTTTAQQYVVAGQKFPQGLPASSTFFNNQQYTPGTDASVPIGGGASAAATVAVSAAQAAVNAATAAKTDATANLATANANLTAANATAATADAAAVAAANAVIAGTGTQAAADAAAAAAAIADTAATAAADAAAAAATAAKQAQIALNKANKNLGIAQNSAIKTLNAKAPMARISWQELRIY
jgi:type IV pilus assembly protein PilY1